MVDFNKVNIVEENRLINFLNMKLQQKYIKFATEHTVELCEKFNKEYRPKMYFDKCNYVIPLSFRYVNGKLWTKYPLHFVGRYERDFTFYSFSPDGKRYQFAGLPYEGDTVDNQKLTYFDIEQTVLYAAQSEYYRQLFTVHNVNQLKEILPYYYKYMLQKTIVEIPTPYNVDLFEIQEYDIQD